MEPTEVIKNAQLLFDYHHLPNQEVKTDFFFVTGSSRLETAEVSVQMYQKFRPLHVLYSGGFGSRTKVLFTKPESEVFAEYAISRGIPREIVLMEKTSTNLLENITNSISIVNKDFPEITQALAFSNPWVIRRLMAHLEIKWPQVKFYPVTPNYDFQHYYQDMGDDLVSILVKDLSTIINYGGKDLTSQDIPSKTMTAYNWLINYGYPRINTQP